ncbi:hypothetical protein HBB16_14830 [Pseudonocardia sp. MCCB 268]|nr:hypothetical protein [Pseudonocardia cytotoxica]
MATTGGEQTVPGWSASSCNPGWCSSGRCTAATSPCSAGLPVRGRAPAGSRTSDVDAVVTDVPLLGIAVLCRRLRAGAARRPADQCRRRPRTPAGPAPRPACSTP